MFPNILTIFILFYSGLFLAVSPSVQAQSREHVSMSDVDSSLNDFTALKEQINGLLEENQNLETQRAQLADEYGALQSQIASEQKEMEAVKASVFERKSRRTPDQFVTAKEGELKKVQDELLIVRSRISYLNKELADFADTQQARELQLKDLDYQKKTLQMEAKLKEFALDQAQSKREEQVGILKAQLEELTKVKDKLSGEIDQLEAKNQEVPQQMEALRKENIELGQKVSDMELQKDLKEKEVEILKTKKMYLTRLMESDLWPKEKEKAEMEEKIASLEQKLGVLNEQLDKSLSFQQNKKKLMAELIKFDSENQSLRQKIEELKNTIKVE